MQVTVGADPEFFVRKITTKEFVPICGLLGGTKQKPLQIKGLDKGFMMQEDGAAAEFNIPPARDGATFADNVYGAMSHLTALLAEKGLEPDKMRRHVQLANTDIANFPKLAEIGCDPDYYAYHSNNGKYPEEGKRVLAAGGLNNIRGVGGHVHIGYDKNIIPPPVLARLLDLFLASNFIKQDRQGPRRNIWGLPGLFREKEYGVEYRTLSNFWVWEPTITQVIGDICINLVNSIQKDIVGWQALYNSYAVQYINYLDGISTENPAYLAYDAAKLRTNKLYIDVMNRAGFARIK